MLERVALGQTRFMTPGVSPDPRGVVLGRHGLLLFPSIEGVVSWLRVFAAESSLDEILAGLTIQRLSTSLRGRAMSVRIPAQSSHVMDRAARCAKLVGGTMFTGTSKHYVRYRDDSSPYGYDASEIPALPDGADFVCHEKEFRQGYREEGEVSFEKLLFRLSMRRSPAGQRLTDDQRRELLVLCARGLGDGVVRYLWRNRVAAEAAIVKPKGKSSFDDSRGREYLALKVEDIPARILELFLGTPGVDVFALETPNVACEVGYSHPVQLSSCASIFDDEKFYLFWGNRDRVEVVDEALDGVALEHLTRIGSRDGDALDPVLLTCEEPESVGVKIQLERSLHAPRHVSATLVPKEQSGWLKQLVYFLPQTSLRGHSVAVTDRGVLVLADENVDVVPLGQPLVYVADGLLIPLGMDVAPRVTPEVLSAALGHGAGVITVFPAEGEPFQVKQSELAPLERRAVAKLDVETAEGIDVSLSAVDAPRVVNDPVGRFALWGFKGPKEPKQKALPPKPDEDTE